MFGFERFSRRNEMLQEHHVFGLVICMRYI